MTNSHSKFHKNINDIKDKKNLLYLNNMLLKNDIKGIGGELIKIMHEDMPYKDFLSIINGFGLKLKLVDKNEVTHGVDWDSDDDWSIPPVKKMGKVPIVPVRLPMKKKVVRKKR